MGIPYHSSARPASATSTTATSHAQIETGAASTDSLLRAVRNISNPVDLKRFFDILFGRMSLQAKEGVAELLKEQIQACSLEEQLRMPLSTEELLSEDDIVRILAGGRYQHVDTLPVMTQGLRNNFMAGTSARTSPFTRLPVRDTTPTQRSSSAASAAAGLMVMSFLSNNRQSSSTLDSSPNTDVTPGNESAPDYETVMRLLRRQPTTEQPSPSSESHRLGESILHQLRRQVPQQDALSASSSFTTHSPRSFMIRGPFSESLLSSPRPFLPASSSSTTTAMHSNPSSALVLPIPIDQNDEIEE